MKFWMKHGYKLIGLHFQKKLWAVIPAKAGIHKYLNVN
jgi:hypothetical protein